MRRVRQKPIGNYILDFYCASKKWCIEIDGSSHDEKGDYDTQRDKVLKETYGIETIRYTAEQIDKNLQGVCDDIMAKCAK